MSVKDRRVQRRGVSGEKEKEKRKKRRNEIQLESLLLSFVVRVSSRCPPPVVLWRSHRSRFRVGIVSSLSIFVEPFLRNTILSIEVPLSLSQGWCHRITSCEAQGRLHPCPLVSRHFESVVFSCFASSRPFVPSLHSSSSRRSSKVCSVFDRVRRVGPFT